MRLRTSRPPVVGPWNAGRYDRDPASRPAGSQRWQHDDQAYHHTLGSNSQGLSGSEITGQTLGGVQRRRADLGHGLRHHVAPPRDLPGALDLAPFVEARIEPEIAFGLRAASEPGMDERALLDCVAWVAHGFEIVQSLYPGWRFTAADTAAAF